MFLVLLTTADCWPVEYNRGSVSVAFPGATQSLLDSNYDAMFYNTAVITFNIHVNSSIYVQQK